MKMAHNFFSLLIGIPARSLGCDSFKPDDNSLTLECIIVSKLLNPSLFKKHFSHDTSRAIYCTSYCFMAKEIFTQNFIKLALWKLEFQNSEKIYTCSVPLVLSN